MIDSLSVSYQPLYTSDFAPNKQELHGHSYELIDTITETEPTTKTKRIAKQGLQGNLAETEALLPGAVPLDPVEELNSAQIHALLSVSGDSYQETVDNMVAILREHPDYFFASRQTVYDTPLSDYPSHILEEVLNYYGTSSENPLIAFFLKQPDEVATLATIAKLFVDMKGPGLFSPDGWGAVAAVLRGYLVENKDSLTAADQDLLKSLLSRCIYAKNWYYRYILPMTTMVYTTWFLQPFNPDHENKYNELLTQYNFLLDHALEEQLNAIDARQDKPVGQLIEGGWPGHFFSFHFQKIGDQYLITLANAGDGLQYHEKEVDDEGDDRYRTVRMFCVEDRAQMKETLRLVTELAFHCDVGYIDDRFYDPAQQCYDYLADNLVEVDLSAVPFREPQTVGNCAVRNLLEMAYFVMQVEEQTELANSLQDYIIRMGLELPAIYPALDDNVAKAPEEKQPIEPLDGTIEIA